MAIPRRALAFAVACVAALSAARGGTPELPDSVDSVADLALDPAFGEGGIITSVAAAGGRLDEASFVAIDGSGRVVVAGAELVFGRIHHAPEPVWAPRVARLLADGSLDPSFGDGGVAALPLAGFLTGMTLGDAGRIVVCGQFQGTLLESGTAVFGAAALADDGALDAGFSDDGLLELDASTMRLNAVHAGPSGALYAGAIRTQSEMGVVRILADGRFDAGYAADGFADVSGYVTDLAADSGGRVVVATTDGLFGLDATGALDSAFGADGRLVGVAGAPLWSRQVEIDAQDRIVVYGEERDHRRGFFRFLPDGTPDPLFAGDGVASRPLGVPGIAILDGPALAVAPGDTDRYVVVGRLEFRDYLSGSGLSRRGWFLGAFDPQRARSVAALSYRDPRSTGVETTGVDQAAVAHDGSYAVAVGFTYRVEGAETIPSPIVVRVDLAHETPGPVANLRIEWSGPVLASNTRRQRMLTGGLRVRNTGGRLVESVGVWLYVTSGPGSDEPGEPIGYLPVGEVWPGGETPRWMNVGWSHLRLSRRALRHRKVVAVLDVDGLVPQSDTSDDVAVSELIRPLPRHRRR